MSRTAPTVVATRFGAVHRMPGDAPGAVRVTVEWMITTGAARSGKTEVVAMSPISRDDVRLAIMDALTARMNALYAPEVFRNRDVLVIGL